LYYEVYDPGRTEQTANQTASAGKDDIRLLSNVSFFRGTTKAYESSVVEVSRVSERDKQAAIFQLDVPLTSLKPGFYICQVNVIDDAAGHFLFPRVPLLVREEKSQPQTN
jgi:hypothetical protein